MSRQGRSGAGEPEEGSGLDRRSFLKLSGSGLTGLGARSLGLGALGGGGVAGPGLGAGCAPPPDREPELGSTRCGNRGQPNTIQTFSTRAAVLPGQGDALRKTLVESDGIFTQHVPGVHNARLSMLDDEHLLIAICYDRSRELAMDFMSRNAVGLESVLQYCVGYAPGSAANPALLDHFLKTFAVENLLFYRAYQIAEPGVAEGVLLREKFLVLLQEMEVTKDIELPYLFERFVTETEPLSKLSGEGHRPARSPECLPEPPLRMSALTMTQTIKSGKVKASHLCPSIPWSQNLSLEMERIFGGMGTYVDMARAMMKVGQWETDKLHTHPLGQLHTLHFARAAIIDGNRLLFSSVYDGDFEQYVWDFRTRIPDQMDALFCLTEGYPDQGSRDVPAFMEWIRKGQVNVESFYGGTLAVSLKEIQSCDALCARLRAFTGSLKPDSTTMRAAIKDFVARNQELLG